MALIVSKNNHCVYSITSGTSLTTKAKEEKKELDIEELGSIIHVLPEMRNLEEEMDTFYSTLHDDVKLPLFTTMFCQILTTNSTALHGLDSLEKSQILFSKYVDLTLAILYDTQTFKIAFENLQRKVSEVLQDRSSTQMTAAIVNKSYTSRVNSLHSSFIAFAIGNALDIQPWNLRFSYEKPSVDLDLSNVNLLILRA